MKLPRLPSILHLLLFSLLFLSPPLHAEDSAPKKSLQDWATNPSESPTSVAGVRGLDKSKASDDPNARDYEAIERLETVKVTPAELKQFLKEGKLP